MSFEEQLQGIVADLGAISERLDDLTTEVLREAVRSHATRRPDLDRRLTRARRAIERATLALSAADTGEVEEEPL